MTLKDKKAKLFESRTSETPEGETALKEQIANLEKELVEKKKAVVEEESPKIKEKLEEIRQLESEKKEVKKELPKEEEPSGKISPVQAQISNDVTRIKKLDKDNQVESLVKLAFEKNLNYAVNVARNLDNPYVLDELHDTLVDEFYQELIKKGKLKEI